NYQVSDRLKQKVLYRKFNLMTPVFPFRKPFHVIFCRNVMIYFDTPTRDALVRKFYDFLEPGGFLFVGHSEVIDRQSAPFEYVMPSVYRKK
ncbi:MAG: chemotaxis protein CheR, partial [Selenomonadaceae bacterium]|nr:chemotaxis protein CheR [Selenomonadaceae bacterium]